MTLKQIQESDNPEFNMRFWNKYQVGDCIKGKATKTADWFVSRNADPLTYTLVNLKNNYKRKEMLKSLVNSLTELCLSNTLKKL